LKQQTTDLVATIHITIMAETDGRENQFQIQKRFSLEIEGWTV
jgi:hypothetical protein